MSAVYALVTRVTLLLLFGVLGLVGADDASQVAALCDIYTYNHPTTWTESPCNWTRPCKSAGNMMPMPGIGCDSAGQKVQSLSLVDHTINGTITSSLCNLVDLGAINYYNNDLTGSIPETLAKLPLLALLYLWDNQLEGTIPSTFANLSTLIDLRLQNNKLNGSFPEILGHMHTLNCINISHNMFSGTIPSALPASTSIVYLYAGSNKFHGHLPLFHNWTALSYLGLEDNLLSGTIPSQLGNHTFDYLYLNNNFFMGSLPSTLTAKSVYSCSLANNCFVNASWCDASIRASYCYSCIDGGGCMIGGTSCYSENYTVSGKCLQCNQTVDATEWSVADSGTSCDDDDPCSIDDVCDSEGICAGTPYECTQYGCADIIQCDGRGGCYYGPNAEGCWMAHECVDSGTLKPNQDVNSGTLCQVCNPNEDTTHWSTSPCELMRVDSEHLVPFTIKEQERATLWKTPA